uniref:INB domain-containing protein n=1 Tax=Globodera pallida TaxID=36090 RepID=A0A183CAI7_GLOPA
MNLGQSEDLPIMPTSTTANMDMENDANEAQMSKKWKRRRHSGGDGMAQPTEPFPIPPLRVLFLIFLCLSEAALAQDESRQKCLSAEASKSCGACIASSVECAWCSDLRFNGTQRCDAKWAFAENERCAVAQLYSPNTEIKVTPQHNLPLGSRRADGVTVIQLEPQQVEIRMKPGDIVEVPFRYLHKLPLSGYEVRDFTIQTSEFRSLGIDIEFSVECNGERLTGRVCPGVQPEQKISFYAKVTLSDCSRPNLAAVSVGIYGYNTVSAIFVTPLCGCECEHGRQQERHSPRCSYMGNLVCGKCQCDPGKGGERCECDLDKYGVSNADELIGLCSEHKKAPICSGKGQCSCGRCQCHANYLSGRYCECDNTNCPLNVEGRMCGGRGACECGKCVCEHGYSGDDCACDDDPAPCAENGVVCTNNGFCECGKCACNVGWTGERCSVSAPLPEESAGVGAITATESSGENDDDGGGGGSSTIGTTAEENGEDDDDGEDREEGPRTEEADLLPTQTDGAEDAAEMAPQSDATAPFPTPSLFLFWSTALCTTVRRSSIETSAPNSIRSRTNAKTFAHFI